jgi:hypothetical protein
LGWMETGVAGDLHFWDAVMEGQNLRKGFIPCPGESVFSSREKKCSYFVLPPDFFHYPSSPVSGEPRTQIFESSRGSAQETSRSDCKPHFFHPLRETGIHNSSCWILCCLI